MPLILRLMSFSLATLAATSCGPAALPGPPGKPGSTAKVDSSDAVVGTCAMVGAHVSQDGCDPQHQCGTPSLPFCTIAQGILVGGDVKVASSTAPYVEHLVLGDGVNLTGGYDESFGGLAIDDDHTIVVGSVVFPAQATATARRLELRQTVVEPQPTYLPASSSTILVAPSAHAKIEAVRVTVDRSTAIDPSDGANQPPPPIAAATTVATIAMSSSNAGDASGPGGSLTMTDCTVEALDATDRSTALDVNAASATVKLVRSDLVAGAALRSVAVRFRGAGTLSVEQTTLRGGRGQLIAAGIRAVSEPAAALDVDVAGATIAGGPQQAYATDTIFGPIPMHYGVAARDASLQVTGSDVVGNPGQDATDAVGIEIVGTVPVNLLVQGNSRILGGQADLWRGIAPMAIGVHARGDVAAVIEDNALIQGCEASSPCNGHARGIWLDAFYSGYDNVGAAAWGDFEASLDQAIRAAPAWIVADNQLVAGGAGPSATPGVGIVVQSARPQHYADPEPPPATIQVRDNQRVIGNPAAAATGGDMLSAIGLWTDRVAAIIERNHLVAGHSTGSANSLSGLRSAGLRVRRGTVQVRDNEIEGNDAFAYAADLVESQATFERNFVHRGVVGLSFHSDLGSLYANNIVIAGDGCIVGCGPYNNYPDYCQGESAYLFANNLCLATSDDGWALMMGDRPAGSRISSNILDGARPVFGSTGAGFDHNAVVARGDSGCAYWTFGSFACVEPGASSVGTANVGIAPDYAHPLGEPVAADSVAPGPSCPLGAQGATLGQVPEDYLGKPRDAQPDIGPYECP